MLKKGDSLKLLKQLSDGSVDLVYLDPPFFTQRSHKLSSKNAEKTFEFDDKWDSLDEYIEFLRLRLKEMKRVLKPSGSIFFHCDKAASHHIRVLLDEVFGVSNFQSEIIWAYKRWSNAKKGLLNSHQNIYFYSKSGLFKFNHLYDDYSSTTNIDQIFQKRQRDSSGKTKYKTAVDGSYELISAKKGVPLTDVWNIPYLNPKASERVGYPTQKPILLLERIISISTEDSDTVLDPFCGSGTTLVAAKLLNRKFIGFDISDEAIELSKKRLENPIKSESQLLKKGEDAYRNLDNETRKLLEKLEIQPVERNKGIDGFARYLNEIMPIPIKVQTKSESLEDAQGKLLKAAKKNGFKKLILISPDELNRDIIDVGDLMLGICHQTHYGDTLNELVG